MQCFFGVPAMKKSTALMLGLFLSLGFILSLAVSFFLMPSGNTVQPSRAHETSDARIDINLADSEELQHLPGIGPVLGERICVWRKENGPFQSPEDLLQVPGIGESTLDGIREYILIGGIHEDSGRG